MTGALGPYWGRVLLRGGAKASDALIDFFNLFFHFSDPVCELRRGRQSALLAKIQDLRKEVAGSVLIKGTTVRCQECLQLTFYLTVYSRNSLMNSHTPR